MAFRHCEECPEPLPARFQVEARLALVRFPSAVVSWNLGWPACMLWPSQSASLTLLFPAVYGLEAFEIGPSYSSLPHPHTITWRKRVEQEENDEKLLCLEYHVGVAKHLLGIEGD